MIRAPLRAIGAAVAFLLAPALPAQQPAASFQVTPLPTVVLAPNDVVIVTYRVQFQSAGADTLAEFAVRSPVPVARVTPAIVPGSAIFGLNHEGRDDAASWGWVRNAPADGETSAPVSYEAVGLPGIVQYRANRWVEPHEAGPGELRDDAPQLSYNASDADQVIGKTVGVVPLPADMSNAALTTRADALAADACALGWIDNQGICNSIRVKIGQGSWNALMNELDAQRGKHINESGYTLLYATAQRMRGS